MIAGFLAELKEKEIQITFAKGKISYSGPEENVTPELLEKLRQNKGKLIKYFWPAELDHLMPINTEGSKTPLFIVHGDNSNYLISDYLGKDQPVYGFFHPGSNGEKIRFHNVSEMASTYLAQIQAVCPTGPYYLIGFSFGGILAFEMAVQLQKSGYQVPILILIDSVSPLANHLTVRYKGWYLRLKKNILGPVRKTIRDYFRMAYCKAWILLNKPVPVGPRKYYLYKTYLKLGRNYQPVRFNGNMLLFRATGNMLSDTYLGWETLVNNIRLVEIEGKHLELFIGRERTELLQQEIRQYLDEFSNHI